MSKTSFSDDPMAGASREEIMSALFANLVLQQSNVAMIFLGKVPHPETGQVVQDLEAARIYIDLLEMLEAKTKGNLDKQEEGLLKQSLTTLRLAFVEAVEQQPARPTTKPEAATATAPGTAKTAAAGESEPKPADEAGASTAEAEARKKFVKKY